MAQSYQETSNQSNGIKNTTDQDRDKFTLKISDDPKITTNQEKVKLIQKTPTAIDDCSSGSEDLFKDEDSSVLSESSPSQKNNRISCKSKVNFSKLSNDEKVMRLQNMANKIKKLKQQVRSLKNYKSKKALKAKAIFASMQNKNVTPVGCSSIISQTSNQQNEQKYQQENIIKQDNFAGPTTSFKQINRQFGQLASEQMIQTIPNTFSSILAHNPANQMLAGLSYQQIQNNMMLAGNPVTQNNQYLQQQRLVQKSVVQPIQNQQQIKYATPYPNHNFFATNQANQQETIQIQNEKNLLSVSLKDHVNNLQQTSLVGNIPCEQDSAYLGQIHTLKQQLPSSNFQSIQFNTNHFQQIQNDFRQNNSQLQTINHNNSYYNTQVPIKTSGVRMQPEQQVLFNQFISGQQQGQKLEQSMPNFFPHFNS